MIASSAGADKARLLAGAAQASVGAVYEDPHLARRPERKRPNVDHAIPCLPERWVLGTGLLYAVVRRWLAFSDPLGKCSCACCVHDWIVHPRVDTAPDVRAFLTGHSGSSRDGRLCTGLSRACCASSPNDTRSALAGTLPSAWPPRPHGDHTGAAFWDPDLTMLARLSLALARARAIPLAA
jgi:hypothetical protein